MVERGGRSNGVRNPRFHADKPLWIPAFAGMTGGAGITDDYRAVILHFPALCDFAPLLPPANAICQHALATNN